MPYTPVNVGTVANDSTGDTNRAGWIKVNTNFASVDTQLGNKASNTDLATEVAARTTLAGNTAAALALKANLASVAVCDASLVLTNDDKRQLVNNTGGHVTFALSLVDGAVNIASGTIKLPMFPQNFVLQDLFVMLTQRTVGSGGTLTGSFSLDQGATNIAASVSGAITGIGKMTGVIAVTDRKIVKELATSATLTIATTETGSPVAKGASLWLRGVWEA